MDIRSMRPEKRRNAYVAWVADDGALSVDVVAVQDWCVVGGAWRPAFRYGGVWVWPQVWAERWPHRALVVAEPRAARPAEAFLRLRAEAVRVARKVEFVAGMEDAPARRIAALEDLARQRAYPPGRGEFDPADPGWWLPTNDAEARWLDALTDAFYDTEICAPRRLRSGSEPAEPTCPGNSYADSSLGNNRVGTARPARTPKTRGICPSPQTPDPSAIRSKRARSGPVPNCP